MNLNDSTVKNPELKHVREFWEKSPLFAGEASYKPGTLEFFEEHRQVIIDDCFAGTFDMRTMPVGNSKRHVLDLGCGPGFWLVELSRNGAEKITGADLTEAALDLSKKRCELYNIKVALNQENAEMLTYEAGTFSHVNCQGVIHHTPNTPKCVAEMARVLEENGTCSVSVYYKNFFLRNWSWLRFFGLALSWMGAALKGRGRESIFKLKSADEIVRFYDGDQNPIGKAYSVSEFEMMLSPYFEVQEMYLHYFPCRSLPFKLQHSLHKLLDRQFGFMIYATCRKR